MPSMLRIQIMKTLLLLTRGLSITSLKKEQIFLKSDSKRKKYCKKGRKDFIELRDTFKYRRCDHLRCSWSNVRPSFGFLLPANAPFCTLAKARVFGHGHRQIYSLHMSIAFFNAIYTDQNLSAIKTVVFQAQPIIIITQVQKISSKKSKGSDFLFSSELQNWLTP